VWRVSRAYAANVAFHIPWCSVSVSLL
jgi:hypothetical protein